MDALGLIIAVVRSSTLRTRHGCFLPMISRSCLRSSAEPGELRSAADRLAAVRVLRTHVDRGVSRGLVVARLAALLRDERLPVRREATRRADGCGARAADVLTVLRDRLLVEPDARVRQAIRDAIGTIGRRAAAGFLPGVDAAAVAL